MIENQSINWKAFFFSFEGRVNRKKYWLNFFVPFMLISFLLSAIDAMLGLGFGSAEKETGFLSLIFSLFSIWPSIAVCAKRLHDRALSGWWQAAPIGVMVIAGIGFAIAMPLGVVFAVLAGCVTLWLSITIGFLKGHAGPNRFGPDPLQPLTQSPSEDIPAGHEMGAGAQDIDIERVGAGE